MKRRLKLIKAEIEWNQKRIFTRQTQFKENNNFEENGVLNNYFYEQPMLGVTTDNDANQARNLHISSGMHPYAQVPLTTGSHGYPPHPVMYNSPPPNMGHMAPSTLGMPYLHHSTGLIPNCSAPVAIPTHGDGINVHPPHMRMRIHPSHMHMHHSHSLSNTGMAQSSLNPPMNNFSVAPSPTTQLHNIHHPHSMHPQMLPSHGANTQSLRRHLGQPIMTQGPGPGMAPRMRMGVGVNSDGLATMPPSSQAPMR